MGATDGRVVGTTKIVDHGPAASRWNLVLLSEGYQEGELPQYRTAAEAFVDRLYATAPFGDLWCAINVYRVDVASTDSGADDQAACGDGTTGSGTTARTFFDARFCVDNTRRLLAGDDVLALATAQAQVPEVRAAVVIVNSATYGGAGGGVAWFSTHPQASDIGIHELGHSPFRLADEYADLNNQWPGGEPPDANLTTITDRATTKWASLIAAATALPTMSNPNCAAEDTRPSPLPAATVGLFEGGGRARCGVYRPQHQCRMRTLDQPFCAVCRTAIRRVLDPFMPRTLAPTTGVQFSGIVGARATQRWFTHSWPACWHVAWTVVPRGAGAAGPDIRWNVEVERPTRERITYWIEVSNLEDGPVEIEARYAILARQ